MTGRQVFCMYTTPQIVTSPNFQLVGQLVVNKITPNLASFERTAVKTKTTEAVPIFDRIAYIRITKRLFSFSTLE